MKDGLRILDSDLHVFETPDLYERYLDERFRERAPAFMGISPAGLRWWQVDGQPIPPFALDQTIVGPQQHMIQRVGDLPAIYQTARDRGWPADLHLAAMDVEGVDVAVLYRSHAHPIAGIDRHEPAFADALCRAFNDWLHDYCRENPERLKGAGIVTLHDPELAAAEARRCVEQLGFVGIVMLPTPCNGRNLNAPECDVLWAEVERLGVPVGFHPTSVGSFREYVSNRLTGHPNFRTINHALTFPLELMLCLGSLIVGGVVPRFPKLRIALLEGTCGWLPWWLERVDEQFEKYGGGEAIRLEALPSEYFKRQCFISTDVDERLLPRVIDAIGDDNIVVSTDYPHNDGAFPHAIEEFLAVPGVGRDSQRKILWDNCARLYGLNVPAAV